MRKIILTIPFLLSLTACNYFSADPVNTQQSKDSLSKNQQPQKVVVYNGEGNAKEIIKKETENRGYLLNWHAKGRYEIQQNELMAVKGLTFGEALIKLETIFIKKNIFLSELASRNNAKLSHPEYLIMAVCGKELIVKEFTGDLYAQTKKQLEDGLIENCTRPDVAFPSKEEMAKKAQIEAYLAREKEMIAKQGDLVNKQNQTPEIEDGDETPIDINDIDFGYIAITPEFIAQLEKETGQKFNPEIYTKNLQKRRAIAQ